MEVEEDVGVRSPGREVKEECVLRLRWTMGEAGSGMVGSWCGAKWWGWDRGEVGWWERRTQSWFLYKGFVGAIFARQKTMM